LSASYSAALAGYPEPDYIAACVSGTQNTQQSVRISELLNTIFPNAIVQVHPDYVAAVMAAPADADLVVIAGTGSLVCSQTPGGDYVTSGGRGWILGDFGSAARLGRSALEWFCDDPAAASPELNADAGNLLGTSDWRNVLSALIATPSPAAFLASAAPLLTRAVARGERWAALRLEAEMSTLATTVARHIERHLHQQEATRVALSGGVWHSPEAESCFTAAMTRARPGSVIVRSSLSPLDGAVTLAERMVG
jgi:N-acetylglucosamine kinase-like BadF-type ATPase